MQNKRLAGGGARRKLLQFDSTHRFQIRIGVLPRHSDSFHALLIGKRITSHTVKLRLFFQYGLFLLSIGLIGSCKAPPQPGSIPYDLDHPDEVRALPKVLKEISGIVPLDERRLLCIGDDKGEVVVLGLKKGDIKHTIPFGKDHDYEGITLVNDTLFVLNSKGTLFRVTGWQTDTPISHPLHSFLRKENNTEGLCYDARNQRLLLACKGIAGHGPLERLKAVYAFDLGQQQLSEDPVLLIDPDSVAAYLSRHHVKALHAAVDGSIIPGLELFAPSDLALDPATGNLYLLCSVGKLLLVFDPDGKLIFTKPLDPSIYLQPEGIAFSMTGDLLISNEGRAGKASLVILHRK